MLRIAGDTDCHGLRPRNDSGSQNLVLSIRLREVDVMIPWEAILFVTSAFSKHPKA